MRYWNDKPYHSLDYHLRELFGEKVYKIALDGGMTCPNRDGKIATGGCIFCSNGGSGDFAQKQCEDIHKQIDNAIANLSGGYKNTGKKYIAYFQSFTNTYAPVEKLRKLYMDAISHPDVVALSIGTRPDCFSPEIYQLISECNKIKPVWVELGLQTKHEETAKYIRRGYTLNVFEEAVSELKAMGVEVIVHVILGLPGESTEDMLDTIRYLNTQNIDGIKLQLLHILKGTDLASKIYNHDFLHIFEEQEYIDLVVKCIGELSPDIVIHRLTGDGARELLIAPLWSLNKQHVLNTLHHTLKVQQIYQGKNRKEGFS